MANPFPGVDPYIESEGRWPDFHARFLTYLCDALLDRLPARYEASIDEQFRLVEVPDEVQVVEPDVAVLLAGEPTGGRGVGGGEAALAVLEPVTLPVTMRLPHRKERRIEVRRLPERSLVAVVEVLSPTNKGRHLDDYAAKRLAVLEQDVHLVELDLLRAGHRPPMDAPLPPGDYFAFVARAGRRPDCDVYAWSVRRVLPPIPIPLRAPDPDVTLDLAAVYDTAHRNGRYSRRIAYGEPLTPPLAPEDRGWAEGIGGEAARG